MDTIVDFFTDLAENHLYILIIAGAVVLFAIIGFIADRKKKKKIERSVDAATTGPVEKEEPAQEPIAAPENNVPEAPVAPILPKEPVKVDEPVVEPEVIQNDQFSPFGTVAKAEVKEDEESPLSGLSNNFNFNKEPESQTPTPSSEPTDFQSTEQTKESVTEEPIEEEKSWE